MLRTMWIHMFVALSLGGLASATATAQEASGHKAAPPGARVFFIGLEDGSTVPSRFMVKFGSENVDIVSAGVNKPNSGHHHLLIDAPLPAPDHPIPNDPNHLHFGKGQTEAEIILSPGEHTLQLLLGDQDHVPHDPPVASEVVHVRVDAATVEKPRTPSPAGASVFFDGLQDGATIPTHATIRFGVSGMSVAPAGTDAPNTGHHHLVIDAPTPDLDREIPSDPNHLHFGKGQTQAEVTLSPGPHTLQLVLGDKDHVPHDPPVVSPIIHVTAADQAGSPAAQAEAPTGRTPAPPDAAVYFVYPPKGALIYPRTTVRFGLRNMGVAPAGVTKANTGHHHLLIDVETPPLDRPIPNDPKHLHFGAGQTEKKIVLPPGKHTLQLILGDAQHIPFDPPVMTERIEVTVMGPRKHRKR
ncbi:DUF4399 domain-containing protein [Alsobacter soli]|uniref:DUF4399 domain-containing protein n=1 Tax=Alsobacter soli TaxID=2109933 RepID=UPI001FE060DF|nr:DUF4399 domain-containing protein [Alsobacter soli]